MKTIMQTVALTALFGPGEARVTTGLGQQLDVTTATFVHELRGDHELGVDTVLADSVGARTIVPDGGLGRYVSPADQSLAIFPEPVREAVLAQLRGMVP